MKLLEILPPLSTDILDAQYLKGHLQDYRRPNDKLSEWLKNGELVSLKKGLYLVADLRAVHARSSREAIANRLFGPSYVSFQSALAYYGLIPERVETTLSVTPLRNKKFRNEAGEFIYRHQPLRVYREFFTLSKEGFLIATPEKALGDLVHFEKLSTWGHPQEIEAFLFEDLRLEKAAVKTMNTASFDSLAKLMKSPNVRMLARYLHWLK